MDSFNSCRTEHSIWQRFMRHLLSCRGQGTCTDQATHGHGVLDAANTAVYAAQKNDVTLTGAIDQYGYVGAIGGVVEKARAAKESRVDYKKAGTGNS